MIKPKVGTKEKGENALFKKRTTDYKRFDSPRNLRKARMQVMKSQHSLAISVDEASQLDPDRSLEQNSPA